MKIYLMNSHTGTMQEKKVQKDAISLQEEQYLVMLVTLDEFKASEMMHPCKKDLLHSLNYEKYCKVESFHDCIQGIIHLPVIEGNKQQLFLFGFLLYQKELWLVSDDDAGLLKRAERIREDLYEGFSIQDFLLCFFNHLIEDDIIFLQKIENNLESLEEKVADGKQEHLNEAILQYRRKLSLRHGYYVQLMNIGDYMQSVLRELVPDAESGWGLFTHRVERLHDYVEMIQERLLQIREMYQTQMDMEQNRIVTFLTVITTIFLPLTLMTGWYGMNFEHMPELEWKYGYIIIILVSMLTIFFEVHYFKKKKML